MRIHYIQHAPPQNVRGRRELPRGKRLDESPKARRREAVRLAQLCLSVVLFGVVFAGKQFFPARSAPVLGRMEEAITEGESVSDLVRQTGAALSGDGSMAEVFSALLPGNTPEGVTAFRPSLPPEGFWTAQQRWAVEEDYLRGADKTAQEIIDHYLPHWEQGGADQ